MRECVAVRVGVFERVADGVGFPTGFLGADIERSAQDESEESEEKSELTGVGIVFELEGQAEGHAEGEIPVAATDCRTLPHPAGAEN